MQTNTDELLVRTRVVLDEWFVLVVVTLLALSLFGGWGVYAAFAEEPDDESDDVEWTTAGDFEHWAEVQEENEVFEVGSHLTDRSTYYTSVNPQLDGEFIYTYDAPDGDVDVDVELERIVRAVDESGDEHWIVTESLETTSTESVAPGDEQTAEFEVTVPEMQNESERIEESLGASHGTVETIVRAEVTMSGTIDGEQIEHTDTYELEIDAENGVYHVSEPVAQQSSPTNTDEPHEATTAGVPGLLGPATSMILLFGSLTALGAVSIARVRGVLAPDAHEIERHRVETQRSTYDEWISRGVIPDDLQDLPRIEVETLEELVDVAIDSDRRVIQDDDTYYVVDDVLYVYEFDDDLDRDDELGTDESDSSSSDSEEVSDEDSFTLSEISSSSDGEKRSCSDEEKTANEAEKTAIDVERTENSESSVADTEEPAD